MTTPQDSTKAPRYIEGLLRPLRIMLLGTSVKKTKKTFISTE